MFYYYGAKRALAPKYPRPRYRTVVEPFAGSAQYGVRCLMERSADRLILTDTDPRVVEMWTRLLAMTPAEVLSLALPELGDTTTDPLHMVTAASNSWGACKSMTVTERMARWFPVMLANIAEALPYVAGRTTITLADYTTSAQDEPATYFVDPPYQTRTATGARLGGGAAAPRGAGYAKGSDSDALDFPALGEWCQQLDGHVIAVDQAGADWLPFRDLTGHRSSTAVRNVELVWTAGGNDDQLDLFADLDEGHTA